MTRQRFYVTTPIYYVNDVPHVGHAYSTVLADVLARCHRMLGYDTWFTTGVDEHGLKMQRAAEARGVTPKALCDEMSGYFQDLLTSLGISHDFYVRTTDSEHRQVVQRLAQILYDAGDVYLADYDGWYCSRCERYWTDRDVEEADGRCPDQPQTHEIERLVEQNYYFRMSKYADRLREAVESGQMEIVPEKRRNEVLGFLAKGVRDLCIGRSKDKVYWGIELPFDDRYVTYVWLDALFNYKSSIGYLKDGEADRHTDWWPADVHVVGKDILTTHAVYWPTFLMSAGEPLPRRILAHGWLLDRSGRKLSKTKVAGEAKARPLPTNAEMLALLGRDGARWFLATAMRPGNDTPYDWEIVRERVNTDLANGVGNSANRILKMIGKYADGRLPQAGEAGEPEAELVATTRAVIAAVRAVPETLDIHALARASRTAIDALSAYLSNEKPWSAAKDPANLPRVGEVLAWSTDALRLVGLALAPFMPDSMGRLREVLGVTGPVDFEAESRFGFVAAGTEVGEPPNLFPRVQEADLPSAS